MNFPERWRRLDLAAAIFIVALALLLWGLHVFWSMREEIVAMSRENQQQWNDIRQLTHENDMQWRDIDLLMDKLEKQAECKK